MQFIVGITIAFHLTIIVPSYKVQSAGIVHLLKVLFKFHLYKINQFLPIAMAKDWTSMGTTCVEYIAAGMNALPETDSNTADYSYDDDDNNDDERSSNEESNAIEYSKVFKAVGIAQCTIRQKFCFTVWKVDEMGNS